MAKKGSEEEVVEEGKAEAQGEKKEIGPGAWEIPIPSGAEFGGVPEGTYLSKCTEEPKESLSSKQEPQTEFQFVVCDPEHPDFDGREGRYWCSRKPKAWWNITQTLDAMGVPYEIIRDAEGKPTTFRFDPMDCVGAMCKTVWTEQTFEGRTRSRIQRVISAEENVEDLSSDDIPF